MVYTPVLFVEVSLISDFSAVKSFTPCGALVISRFKGISSSSLSLSVKSTYCLEIKKTINCFRKRLKGLIV